MIEKCLVTGHVFYVFAIVFEYQVVSVAVVSMNSFHCSMQWFLEESRTPSVYGVYSSVMPVSPTLEPTEF